MPSKVISFLVLPLHPAFDPSLVYLAIGALPLSALLYRYGRGTCKPRLGGTWDVPNSGTIDAQLLLGAGVFGIGWGMSGICRMCFFFHPSDANLYNNIHIFGNSRPWPRQSGTGIGNWGGTITSRVLVRFGRSRRSIGVTRRLFWVQRVWCFQLAVVRGRADFVGKKVVFQRHIL